MVISSFELRTLMRNISTFTGRPEAELPPALEKIREAALRYETGLLSTDEFFRTVLERTGLVMTREQFRLAYNNIFKPIPENRELIRRLKPLYKLGLLSNTSEWHFQHAIRTTDVFPLFDAVTLSFEVRAMKPEEILYRDILTKLRSLPEECVYIDDIQANVEAAERLGMHGIHYRSPSQLLLGLRALGIPA
jgi:HAD superfamily hydrolase (TIGR01509 family)